MFARFARLPLRRSLHTQASSSQARFAFNRTAYALGGSAVVASYITWRLSSESHRISLDGEKSLVAQKQPSTASPEIHTLPLNTPLDDATPLTPPEKAFIDDVPPKPDSDASEESKPKIGEEAEEEKGESADAGSQGAYNPVTGEINWDCPCLGGMAHGPCGPEFREAFSCFVHSEDEPKGINCVEKFKGMQTCFRAHPEIYGEDAMDDDDDDEEPATTTPAAAEQDAAAVPSSSPAKEPSSTPELSPETPSTS